MKIFTKKRICFGAVIAAVLGLAQCDGMRTFLSHAFFPTKPIDFPQGEGKTISYPINSWADKPYAITLNVEYLDSKKAWDSARLTVPYHFSVQCYRLENGNETLIFEREYSLQDKKDLLSGDQGWDSGNISNPDVVGSISYLSFMRFPYGEYRCDFKDKSPTDIKTKLKEAGITRMAVEITPYEQRLIY